MPYPSEKEKATGNGRSFLKQTKSVRLDRKSRMSGDVHVRFCERLEGKFLGATRLGMILRDWAG